MNREHFFILCVEGYQLQQIHRTLCEFWDTTVYFREILESE